MNGAATRNGNGNGNGNGRRNGGRPGRFGRGQPLRVLVLVMLAWAGARYLTWSEPFAMPAAVIDLVPAGDALPLAATDPAAGLATGLATGPQAGRLAPQVGTADGPVSDAALPLRSAPSGFSDPAGWAPPPLDWTAPPAGRTDPPVPSADHAVAAAERDTVRVVAGHTMLMAAGFSQMQVPPAIAALLYGESPAGVPQAAPYRVQPAAVDRAGPDRVGNGRSRWSADGWLMWRNDTTTPVLSGRPSYGRSQAGAVVRYRLAAHSGNAPEAHLRASTALQGAREREVAAGLSARPLARLPLRVAAEMRASDHASGREWRPAAYAVTELAPRQLPGGGVGQVYLQAGYVGGDNATAFVDGQARVERSLADSADFDLRAGAGAWGGAQEGAARLDIGPTAAVTFRVGDGRGRLAADYRFRIAGDAQPSSGPALTLSAGF